VNKIKSLSKDIYLINIREYTTGPLLSLCL